MAFIDEVTKEVSFILQQGLGIALEGVRTKKQDDSLLRRLSKNYDNLSVEDVVAIRQATGHKDGEDTPCKACKTLAKTEMSLED